MANEELVNIIKGLFEDILLQRGFELVDVTYRFENGRNVLRCLVDLPTGGISLEACAGLNRALGQMLEERAIICEDYVLEVASPGLDRPLRTQRDFARNMGKQIKVFLIEPINGKIEVDGTASDISEKEVTVLTRDGCLSVPLEKINKAKLII
jgi:ribosome maturation factor RimP